MIDEELIRDAIESFERIWFRTNDEMGYPEGAD